MNAEQIDLYRAIQDRRGEWRVGDGILYHGRYGIVRFIRKGSIGILYEDESITFTSPDDPDLLWIPPVWSEDKRCLWKMVKWCPYDITVHHDGKASVWRWPCNRERGRLTTSKGTTLPEALLRAIGGEGEKK